MFCVAEGLCSFCVTSDVSEAESVIEHQATNLDLMVRLRNGR